MAGGFQTAPMAGVTIAHATTPRFSGDCAHVSYRPDGTLVALLADVAGHGPTVAALARDLERRVARMAGATSCAELLTRLNTWVESAWPADVFVTAVCLALDPATGDGTVALAGQLPPIVKHATGARALAVDQGPALGLVSDHRYVGHAFRLNPGELPVALTDGITDPLATSADYLGLSAAVRVIDEAAPQPLDICSSLLEAAGTRGLHDDATVLAGTFRAPRPASSSLHRAAASQSVQAIRLAA